MNTWLLMLQTAAPYALVLGLGYIGGKIHTARKRIGPVTIPIATRDDGNWTRAMIGISGIVLYLALTSWIANTREATCRLATSDVITQQVEAAQMLGGYGVSFDAITQKRSAALTELLSAPEAEKVEAANLYADRMADYQTEWDQLTTERDTLVTNWPAIPDRVCEAD